MKSKLVDYESDSESEDAGSGRREDGKPPAAKKRKLTPFVDPSEPKDDPSLHQGRKRTVPFVEGQFCAYVYVPIFIPVKSGLAKVLKAAIKDAKTAVPILHPIDRLSSESDAASSGGDELELHVSLTRPIYLRAHQREELKCAVKSLAHSHRKFHASFAKFDELQNDEATRTFVVAEVGAGWDNLKALTSVLSPAISALRQSTFYDQPRYHISIAWALLDGAKTSSIITTHEPVPAKPDPCQSPTSSPRARPPKSNGTNHGAIPKGDAHTDEHYPPPESEAGETQQEATFPTIPHLPPSLIPALNEAYASRLAKVAQVDVEKICVRIGKQLSSWSLQP
ncbi:hypothetical protein PUNSTDRAFT_139379 [Punctularia strigosozonata HHB-11173 SS5]|uniref:U6 snRNA phosphodiesterase 1 n=1 Tax=Punctularia strigosozonata (strain HHB-11173) TaxID=741275 RepID=R7S335_PUNST|nr:uncharacterized protein PUNSTDRAFT_139379 [Punctularia strigosozonata HHB-11173 SS5]EIN03666.1 hypothetical protein PUNSTDRAFT_139379 [Punctularia strigosozonata HHB-11173 SS5]